MLDTQSRICPVLRVCWIATAWEVIPALDEAVQRFGKSKIIRVDQGCQFTSRELDLWAYSHGVTLDFSRPGKPTDNAYIEPFNARVRAECLNQNWFMDLDEARLEVEDWRVEYNEVRLHSAIGDRPPMALLHQALGCSRTGSIT
jgi:putative transposase